MKNNESGYKLHLAVDINTHEIIAATLNTLNITNGGSIT
ncbi:hypothetical protein BTN50_2064 [Candidatus Enterovibrio altilux]|uniref:Mobile element protein n=1 Tax=Candidatus Enterovibrio altilux TaxID=1927128 RepID=A0A291BBV4_9GAMM|nr:hypothetical protein BTN50_2064 [Candidatus Enterovibrio luxaltus]